MFELLKNRLQTILSSDKRLARRIRKDIKNESRIEEHFEKMEQELTEDIKTGDVELVEDDIEQIIQELRKMFHLVYEVENFDSLVLYHVVNGIGEEESEERNIEQRLNGIDISSDQLPEKVTKQMQKEGVKNFKELVAKRLHEAIQPLQEMHEQETKVVHEEVTGTKQEHYALSTGIDMHRLQQMKAAMQAFPKWEARKQARQLRRYIKKEKKEEKEIEKKEEHINNLLGQLQKGSNAQPEALLDEIEEIKKEIKKQQKEFTAVIRAIKYLFMFQLYRFFHYYREDLKKLDEEEGTLKKEGFPEEELQKIIKEEKDALSQENNEIFEVEREIRRIYQLANQ